MIILISNIIKTIFLVFFLLVIAPTLVFLTRWYYANLIGKKTYVGIIELPSIITNSDDVINSAKNLFSSSEIKAIIIKCDSIGGNAGSCYTIYSDLLKLRNLYDKPLIAFIEKECLSGAYAIATAADVIVASPSSTIGKFGVFSEPNDVQNEELAKSFESQYFSIIEYTRTKKCFEFVKKSCSANNDEMLTGDRAKKNKVIDSLGGQMEIETIIRKRTTVEGKIETVRGSIIDHFVSSISNIVHRIINGVK